MIDIITLNYNDANTTISFVNSVKDYKCVSHIIVVDNKSSDDSVKKLNDEFLNNSKITILQADKNGGYGAGNNIGIRYLWENFKSKYILLSNPDVIVKESTIEYMEAFLDNNLDYSITAPFMLDKNGVRQYNSATIVPTRFKFAMTIDMFYAKFARPMFYKNLVNTTETVLDVDIVSGSMFMFRTSDMINCGLFDENVFLYFEETILGFKIKELQKKVALLPSVSFIHNHSVSISKTYKSEVQKKKIALKSQLYVLKQYYKVSKFALFFAKLLTKISILETALNSWIKSLKKTKRSK